MSPKAQLPCEEYINVLFCNFPYCVSLMVCTTVFSIIQTCPVYPVVSSKVVLRSPYLLRSKTTRKFLLLASLDIFNIWRPYLVYGILHVAYYCKFDGVTTPKSTNARPYRPMPSLSFMFISCQFTSFSYPRELPLHLFRRGGLYTMHHALDILHFNGFYLQWQHLSSNVFTLPKTCRNEQLIVA